MNKQAELTRWTPKRLLSLLMALIMTLSLLPTAALAAAGDYTINVTDAPDQLITNQQSADITATLKNTSPANKNVGLRLTVSLGPTATGGAAGDLSTVSVNYNLLTSPATAYGAAAVSSIDLVSKNNVAAGGSISDNFNLTFGTPGKYLINVDAVEDDGSGGNDVHVLYHTTITVKDAIESLTVTPTNPEAGQPFTVRAGTAFNSGHVAFTYNGDTKSVPVSPLPDNKGYAEYTFIADAAATGPDTISATLFGVAGISDATKTATVNVGTPATYHTVTFHENAAGVYNMPAPQPVKDSDKATLPTVKPQRDGYTFGGWYTNAACTGAAFDFTTDTVTTDLELYAKWDRIKYPVNLLSPSSDIKVHLTPATATFAGVGDTVDFNVTVPAKYDTTNMLVGAGVPGNDIMLAPTSQHTNSADGSTTFYYHFVVEDKMIDRTSNPTTPTILILVNPLSEKTFTVMMPTGHFDAEITAATPAGSTVAGDKKSASIVYGGSYTFTVTPKQGYDVEVYVNGVKKDAGTGNSYTVTDVTGPQRVEVVESAIPNYNVTFTVPLSGQTFTQSVARGNTATEPGVAPEREGYKFDGWYDETAYNAPGGTEFDFSTPITKDTILFGKLTPKTYNIEYNLNSGTDATNPATITAQTKTHGLAEKLSETVPTREGYTFLGWGTTASATAASYQPGDMYSVDGNITLYAVWQQKTYTITFSSGEGYSLHNGHASMTVAHGANFDFNLIVDRDYAENEPKVWKNTDGVNSGKPLDNGTPTTNQDGSKKYHYTLTNVTENIAINVDVRSNTIYTVTFMTNGSIYQTQQVGYNEKATRPVDPVVEGYTFGGWYKESTCDNAWNFVDVPATAGTTAILADTVTKDTTIYAKLTPIKPVITWKTPTATDGYTIAVAYTAPGATDAIALTTPGAVPYKSTVTFTITILDGYDASQMQVGVNNQLLAPKDKSADGKTYTFEFIAKENTNITVVGVARKTVTIIYNDNGGYGGPVQETVNYYLLNDTNNDKISETKPTREGYDFKGWSTDNKATWDATANKITHESSVIDATDLQPGKESPFISDTVLYAVWQAKETGIKLEVSNTIDDTATLKAQYEGENVTLTATITSGTASVTTGSVQFYRCTDADPTAPAATWTLLNSAVVSGGTAIYTAETSGFKYGGTNTDTYKAVFIPTEGNGYTEITSDTKAVTVKSTAISWELDKTDSTTHKIKDKANVLTIKQNGTEVDSMVAGQVYTLELPAIYALDEQVTPLTVKQDYSVTWQYRNDKGVWTDYTNSGSGDTTTVDAAYSQYVFRAVVTPVTGETSHFTKAAKYTTDGALVNDQYETMLISEPTTEVTLQTTKTDLVITGHNIEEDAGTVINGTAKFRQKHLAQFEGQTVILKATVIDSTSKNAVADGGKVYFYRYVDGTNDVKLNQTAIVVNNGIAELSDVTIKAYDASTGKYFNSDANIDRFYAVYEGDATYATSASVTYDASTGYAKPVSVAAATADSIFIKSTAIKTPIIESKLEGEGGKKATTYTDDLTGLLAGVEHTFKLRTGNAEPDWSVVALDGRTVDAKNYTIQWITKSGDNAETTAATDSKFKTSDNKVGDEIYVRLNPTGDMKTGADSKKAIIGTKQGVKVTVEAIDAIDKTPTAKDVYQLNEIELRATVTAADAKASMQPDGLVQFYYVDDNNFVEIGKPVSIQTVGGARYASIKTNQLPVTAVDNTKRDVKITAVYLGDTTFKASDNWQLKSGSTTEWEVTAADITDTVKSDTVTVYSSVVFAGDSENKATTTPSTDGITITANGKLKANEAGVTLTLGQVYTLDHPIDLSKLTYNTDYTVQWQILENALQHQDSGSAGSYASTTAWKDLSGQTGMNYTGTMEQDAAYRAKITVKDTPIAKGSFTKVDQAIKGRDVYYSNVLVVGVGMATVTTNITTSANQKFNEEGIVSGETATIHVLASGAAKTTPISTVTATITKSGATEPVFNEKANNVNGYTSFAWDTANLTPGYYTLTVTAESNNGYAPQTITRTLIVRDNAYTLSATTISKVYNGKAQGIDWELTGVDIEDALAQKSVVVYYYDKDGKMVEPTQAGEYQYDLYLPASAYWTELEHVSGTFTIEKRPVEVVDLVAQAKVYDGTNNANIQEIILNDSAVDSDGTATGDKGIIDGDSVYAVGTGYTSKDTAGTDATLGVKDVSLKGDDAANYTLSASGYTEVFNIQRSQVKGAIVSGRTYKYTGKDIKLAASDIYLIDQAGNQLTNYDVTYYYHNGDGVEKVDAMNKMGKYTVIARPEQDNYKGGATETVYVGTTDNAGTLDKSAVSSLITISNTVELYGAAENKGIVATATKGTATAYYYYNNGTSTDWYTDAPANAGRYLVKVTTSTGDTAYGLYTVVKARPEFTPTTDKSSVEYTSGRYDGTINAGFVSGKSDSTAETYITYTGGTIQDVAYEAPTEVGKYIATVHVGETANYTAHEKQVAFDITPKALTITADDISRQQYGAYPDLTASFKGLATGGVAADTSLRDVQIQPEFLFNEQKGGYTNHAYDQVGTYPVTVRNALARNYTVTYVGGTIATTAEEPKAELAIHGMPDNGTPTENLVYYGDTIQLYAYGYYKTLDSNTSSGSYNTSSLIEWSVSDASIAEIDQSGLLTIKGVGTFTVTLTRGSGSAAISTDINVEAKPKEVSIDVPDVDKVYTASEQTYNGTVTVNGLINSDSVTPTVTTGTDKRTVVGSQITSYKVPTTKYVSETYGGLFTINVKDVDIKPTAADTIYGTRATGLTFTKETPAGSDKVLADDKTVSVADAYGNLDVYNGYEILVAGKEDSNYNVHYQTKNDREVVGDVNVKELTLTISTGTLKDQIGMTSGSLNPMGKYPVNGAAIDDPAPAMGPSNVRMYGEPNWVMDEELPTLISGDTLADLAALGDKLVKFNYNIGADANVSYTDKTTKLTVSGSAMSDYEVLTDASKMAFKNYNETYTLGTQNIYQRPVTLSVPSGMTLTAYKPSILDSSNQVKNDVLLNLLLNNLIVSKYNNEGGLAELLKHTIKDLDIRIKSTQVTGDKLTVKIALGNQNYWLNSANEQTFEITLVTEKIVPKYSTLDWTSFSVTMYDAEGKAPVSVNGAVNFYIFKKKDGADLKYSDYKNDPIIRSGPMTPTGSTGQYVASFERLPAGEYAYFAIAQNYTIVE